MERKMERKMELKSFWERDGDYIRNSLRNYGLIAMGASLLVLSAILAVVELGWYTP